MGLIKKIVYLAADLGEWLETTSRKKSNAIILVILAIIAPIGFLFATSLIAHSYRKGRKKL